MHGTGSSYARKETGGSQAIEKACKARRRIGFREGKAIRTIGFRVGKAIRTKVLRKVMIYWWNRVQGRKGNKENRV